jgi:hypothetical protein
MCSSRRSGRAAAASGPSRRARCGVSRALRVLLVALALAVAARVAVAAPPPVTPARPTPFPPPAATPYPLLPPSWCWIEVRLFDTLRYGPIDVCRKRLRYRPGALECYHIVDRVCATVLPDGQVLNGRTPTSREVVPCPAGVEPPVCRRLDIE